MSSLDFLSPDRAKADLGFSPVLASPMGRRQRDAGATFAERDGWRVAVGFPDEAEHLTNVGVADLSHLGKLEVRGKGEPESGKGIVWYQMRPDRAIVLCPTRDTFLLRSTLARRFDWVLDQTGAWGVMAIVGPETGPVLRRLTELHHFPGSGRVAHVTGHVLVHDGAHLIVFAQEYGHYLWEVAVDAAARFGGGPVGVDAALGGRS